MFIESPYFDHTEDLNNTFFEAFNDTVKWFTETHRQAVNSVYDYKCKDYKGRIVNVELKVRSIDINKFDTLFIEPKKWDYLMKRWNEEKEIPLYINFFQDGSHVGVLDLRKISTPQYKMIHLYDKGHTCFKDEERILIPTRYFMYFEYGIKKW